MTRGHVNEDGKKKKKKNKEREKFKAGNGRERRLQKTMRETAS